MHAVNRLIYNRDFWYNRYGIAVGFWCSIWNINYFSRLNCFPFNLARHEQAEFWIMASHWHKVTQCVGNMLKILCVDALFCKELWLAYCFHTWWCLVLHHVRPINDALRKERVCVCVYLVCTMYCTHSSMRILRIFLFTFTHIMNFPILWMSVALASRKTKIHTEGERFLCPIFSLIEIYLYCVYISGAL